MPELAVRKAKETDAALIEALIKELAQAEQFPHEVSVTEDELKKNLFRENPAAEVLLFYQNDKPAGFAVFYQTFATTTGRRGLHLDDLYIRPEFQGQGIGKKALGVLASIAKQRGCGRFEWWALKWNQRAIELYETIGAHKMKELRVFRLLEEDIERVSTEWDI
jgi:ribosomal protein S18 acetylase RimI-like enzyme